MPVGEKKKEGKVEMGCGGLGGEEGAFANGSEVCRLKSVDNHGLALPSPSSSFNCVVSFSSPFLLFVCMYTAELHVYTKSMWVMYL